ncbi:cytochrome p450 [Moniliophthora roreri MCA 2997]|uniref:Cytochrome p450 n=1 Tax=Moniliophthora roreri (strain MCA 2997) TaxID=1381753 RepID=V2YX54_MONRO|nr:cytochrome p450 [Moniliophthora roreri MCA 2997]
MDASFLFPSAVQGLLLTLLAYVTLRSASRSRKRYPLGPNGLPFIGNALQILPDRQWLKWHEWKKEYGDIIRITVLGQPAIILSSLKIANDFLETRGSIYSDRPIAVMAGELVGWNRGLGYAPSAHNPRFREFRRLFHQFIGPRACATKELQDTQERENLRLLGKLLDDPAHFADHARDSTSSTILLLSYGYPSHIGDLSRLQKMRCWDSLRSLDRAGVKHVPAWFPGGYFKRIAAKMREDLDRLYDVPYDYAKREMSKGISSFVSVYLDEKKGTPTLEEEELVKAAAASLYSGGAETSPPAINSFLLAMTLYTSVQYRAKAEIEAHLSRDSSKVLPTLTDRDALPYITAVMLEVWRWNPSVPLGLPHLVTQDDEYQEYYIEKGTVVWANIWSILHEEQNFPDPFEFKPERYLNASGKLRTGKGEPSETVSIAFGLGRRLCPGLYLAENSV